MSNHHNQTSIRLQDFSDPESVYQSLQGFGLKGDLISRATHEGVEVSGVVPSSLLPSFHLHQLQRQEARARFNNSNNNSKNSHHQQPGGPNTNNNILSQIQNQLDDDVYDHDSETENEFSKDDDHHLEAKYSLKRNIFLQSQKRHEKEFRKKRDDEQEEETQQQQHTGEITHSIIISSSSSSEPPPPKTLGWLHAIIESFFVFRTKQFEIKQGNSLHYALSDDSDKSARMIVPAPITDDVAFHVFEMVSERYGVPNVVAQQCDIILRTAKYYATRDVSACLFFALLKTPNFDSNDVRFVVEAKKAMRSSLVSQRGIDGILRWFIPLRVVPHVIRKACEHPWARPVLAKTHSAFERLFSDQRRRSTSSSSSTASSPLFIMPAPNRLSLIPPFDSDHPLVGRGPYVDVRGNEHFLGSQPPQLVIGADYLLCMLFCNWLDQRENVLHDTAEGKPVRTITNRRQGRVADGKTLTEHDSKTVNRLQLFALDIDEETGEFVEGLLSGANNNKKSKSNDFLSSGGGQEDEEGNLQNNIKSEDGAADEEGDLLPEKRSGTTTTTTMADLAALAEKYQVGREKSARNNPRNGNNNRSSSLNLNSASARLLHSIHHAPPRVLHLYTKQ